MFKVDKDKCIGCGACVGVCDTVFDFDDDNLAFVKNQPSVDDMELATTALENCPTNAISKEEEN